MDYMIYNMATLPGSVVDTRLLPPDEQALAATRGQRFVLIRSLLRRELSRRTSLPPHEIAFTYNPQGKPCFAPQPFNISHSGDCLCLAFHHLPIGVDVERVRKRDFARLAPRFMCEEQLRGFHSRHCPQDEFYACWCAAEALVKHAGDTMWHALHYPFTYAHGHITCHFNAAPLVQLFTPMPGYSGAIAYTPE